MKSERCVQDKAFPSGANARKNKILVFQKPQFPLFSSVWVKNNTSAKKFVILKKFFSNKSAPKLNVNAKLLMQKFNLKEGKELGKKLKDIEKFWLNNSFSINKKQIEKIIEN